MFIEAQKLINLPVAADDTLSKVGEVEQIMVDPQNGRLLGFLVKTGGLLSQKRALSVTDVADWDPNGLVTETAENVVPIEEILRIKEAVKNNVFLLGMKARTESGKALGKVENFLIDTETQTVVKYYLRDLFGQERILSYDRVVKIDHEITFTDDIDLPQGKVREQAV